MEAALREKIASLPPAPGVYLMKDKAGRVVYVGKAVNLRDRLRSYVAGGDERDFVPLLDRLLGDIDIVVVSNEKAALLLENELIRRYRPRFNARPREGRNFIYLRLDPAQRYPRLEVTRRVEADGARYFGPYPIAHALRDTLRVVNRYFKLRTCSDHDPTQHKRPCLLCQIARFPAPSVYDIPPEEYRRHVEGAVLFLEGKRTELTDALRAHMEEAAAGMRFEEAARLRDQLAAIERTLQPQEIVGPERVDQDAFACCRGRGRLVIYALYVRSGAVIGGQVFSASREAFPDREVLASFLSVYYGEENFVPDEVLLPFAIEGEDALAKFLSERKGSPVRVRVPGEGWRRELVRTSERNAAQKAGLQPARAEDASAVLAQLKARLGLTRTPRRIEGFDVSHYGGRTIVASRVTFTDGEPDKDHYRRYRITTAGIADDYAAIYEVVLRRLRHRLEERDLPDLLVIDGGKGQLASAQAAMKDLGISAIDVIALAKRREVPEAAPPGGSAAELPERIFVPGRREAIVPPPDAPELLLLARLRDEAHRFAIAYERKLARSERLRSQLDEVSGIGAKRRTALLTHFGSLRRIREADVTALAEVEGVGRKTAERLHAYLHAVPERGTERRNA